MLAISAAPARCPSGGGPGCRRTTAGFQVGDAQPHDCPGGVGHEVRRSPAVVPSTCRAAPAQAGPTVSSDIDRAPLVTVRLPAVILHENHFIAMGDVVATRQVGERSERKYPLRSSGRQRKTTLSSAFVRHLASSRVASRSHRTLTLTSTYRVPGVAAVDGRAFTEIKEALRQQPLGSATAPCPLEAVVRRGSAQGSSRRSSCRCAFLATGCSRTMIPGVVTTLRPGRSTPQLPALRRMRSSTACAGCRPARLRIHLASTDTSYAQRHQRLGEGGPDVPVTGGHSSRTWRSASRLLSSWPMSLLRPLRMTPTPCSPLSPGLTPRPGLARYTSLAAELHQRNARAWATR